MEHHRVRPNARQKRELRRFFGCEQFPGLKKTPLDCVVTGEPGAEWHHVRDDPWNREDNLGVFIPLSRELNTRLGTIAKLAKREAQLLDPPLAPGDLESKAKSWWDHGQYGRCYACNRLRYVVLLNYMKEPADSALKATAYALKALRNGLNIEIIADVLKRDVQPLVSSPLSSETTTLLAGELASVLIEANRWDVADSAVTAIAERPSDTALEQLTEAGQVRREAWQIANRRSSKQRIYSCFKRSTEANPGHMHTQYAALEGTAWALLAIGECREARKLLEEPPAPLLSVNDLLGRVFAQDQPILSPTVVAFSTLSHMAFAYAISLRATEGARWRVKTKAVLWRIAVLCKWAGVGPADRIDGFLKEPASREVLALSNSDALTVAPKWRMQAPAQITEALRRRVVSSDLLNLIVTLMQKLM